MNKNITIRFNLAKPRHAKAWERLQKQRRLEEQSYSDSVIEALTAEVKADGDGFATETETINHCAERIADEVGTILRRTIPAFCAGFAANGGVVMAKSEDAVAPAQQERSTEIAADDTIPDEEIPWEYLGE